MRPDVSGTYQSIWTLPDSWQRFPVQFIPLPYNWSNVNFIYRLCQTETSRDFSCQGIHTALVLYILWNCAVIVLEFYLKILKSEERIGAKDKCLKLLEFSKERSCLVSKDIEYKIHMLCLNWHLSSNRIWIKSHIPNLVLD